MPTTHMPGPAVGAANMELNKKNGVSPCSHGNYVLEGKRHNKQINIYATRNIMQNWPLVGGDV